MQPRPMCVGVGMWVHQSRTELHGWWADSVTCLKAQQSENTFSGQKCFEYKFVPKKFASRNLWYFWGPVAVLRCCFQRRILSSGIFLFSVVCIWLSTQSIVTQYFPHTVHLTALIKLVFGCCWQAQSVRQFVKQIYSLLYEIMPLNVLVSSFSKQVTLPQVRSMSRPYRSAN